MALFLFALPGAHGADAVIETFQKALFEEEANQNYDAAIRAYSEVVGKLDDQRKLAATALFRLGECYRKMGRTNEAATQYGRLLAVFSDQTNLLLLARQNLQALGKAPVTAETARNGRLAPQMPSEERAKVKDLLQQELGIAQQFLAEQKQKVKVGTLAPGEEARFERDVLGLRRQLLAVDGLVEPETREQWRSLLREEIALADKAVQIEKAKLDNGRQVPSEVARLQRDVLSLKRELITFDATPVSPSGEAAVPALATRLQGIVGRAEDAAVSDEEEKEIRRIRSLIQDSPDLINARNNTGLAPLHTASGAGYARVVRFLLESGADPNLKAGGPNSGLTALHSAARNGHKSVVDLLIEAKADASAREGGGNTPLHLAAQNGYRLIVDRLLGAGVPVNSRNNVGMTPLHYAVAYGHQSVVELLFKKGADLNLPATVRLQPAFLPDIQDGYTPVHTAVAADQIGLIRWLNTNGANVNAPAGRDRVTPLHLAAQKNSVDAIRALLCPGLELEAPDANEQTPLFYAASGGRLNAAETLLDAGANPNGRPGTSSPLLHTVRESQDMLRLLIAHKVNLETTNQGGKTFLLWVVDSIANAPTNFVGILLEAGANPNAAMPNGYGPLHAAAVRASPEIGSLLLRHGADVNALTSDGATPLFYARTGSSNWRTSEHVEQFVALLMANGADETLQRRRSISVVRRTRGYEASIFSKGTNDFNRHSLFELLATIYQINGGGLPFPDLEHIIVNRALGGGRTSETNIDVEARLAALGCEGDFWLEWGDVVEILEQDHPLPANWAGLRQEFAKSLGDCVSRKFSIVIKGRTNVYALKPNYSSSPFTFLMMPSFRLREVLRSSALLLTSSDPTRVMVSRRDPITSEPRQWTIDTTLPLGSSDLWLRDGDVIEVPDLPPGTRLPVDSGPRQIQLRTLRPQPQPPPQP